MITVTIPTVGQYGGTIPDKATQSETEFANNVYPFHLYYNDNWIPDVNAMSSALDTFKTEANDLATTINETASTVTDNISTIEDAANLAPEMFAVAGIDFASFSMIDGELVVGYYDSSASTPSIVDGEFIITY
jgi:hypothetical protein